MGERKSIDVPHYSLKTIVGKEYDENIFLVPPLYKEGKDTYSMRLCFPDDNRFIHDRKMVHAPAAGIIEGWAQLTKLVYSVDRQGSGIPVIRTIRSDPFEKYIPDLSDLEIAITILKERKIGRENGLFGKLRAEFYSKGERIWGALGTYSFTAAAKAQTK